MKYSTKELFLIWIDSFSNLDYYHKQLIYSIIKESKGIKKSLLENKDAIIEKISNERFEEIINSANDVYLDFLLRKLKKDKVNVLTIESDNYPNSLKNIENPPLVLYAKGNIELLNEENIFCVVGSRKSLPISLAFTKSIVEELSALDITLVTGLAEGVDEMVLKTALDEDGKVISVLANGFDNIYPARNKELFEKVVENGLVITEYPPQIQAKPYFFPIRNRILAGLAKAVLVTSGGIKSGTMYTAQYAGEFGKDLFAVPYSIGVKSGEGCNELIKRGAIVVDRCEDILGYYGLESKRERYELSEEDSQLIKVLFDGEKHIEQISKALNEPTYKIIPRLSVLELRGIVVKNGVNIFALSK